jgi:hypothetical protein
MDKAGGIHASTPKQETFLSVSLHQSAAAAVAANITN